MSCKDIGFGKSEFEAKTLFLYQEASLYDLTPEKMKNVSYRLEMFIMSNYTLDGVGSKLIKRSLVDLTLTIEYIG